MEVACSRDVDAWIAENVFGWGTMTTPPDISGENVSEILVPPTGIHKGFSLPPKGAIHRGYFAPRYTSDTSSALAFAFHVGVESVPTSLANNPIEICKMAMGKHLEALPPMHERKE